MKGKIKISFSDICSKINLFNINKLMNMHELEEQSVEKAKVKLYPTFHTKAPVVQAIDNLEQVGEAIRRMAERTYKKMAESKRGKKLIAKAGEYNIPHDPNDVDWLHLISQIKEYESLLNQARDYNLRVDLKHYDPIAIKDSIEECIFQERQDARELSSYYKSTRF